MIKKVKSMSASLRNIFFKNQKIRRINFLRIFFCSCYTKYVCLKIKETIQPLSHRPPGSQAFAANAVSVCGLWGVPKCQM